MSDDEEEVFAEHCGVDVGDGNDKALQPFDDYLTEFDDIPHEVYIALYVTLFYLVLKPNFYYPSIITTGVF